jgi:hypothetical protein
MKLSDLSRRQLEELPTDVLDKTAFGFKSGDAIYLPLDVIVIKYPDDLENAEAAIRTRADALLLKRTHGRLPVLISLWRGRFELEDGHHRYVAARIRGDQKIWAEVEIKDNPIPVILGEVKFKDPLSRRAGSR